jgi:hypothetical protein
MNNIKMKSLTYVYILVFHIFMWKYMTEINICVLLILMTKSKMLLLLDVSKSKMLLCLKYRELI